MPAAEIGVFGGSGFYEFLDDVEEVAVETPFGSPSAPVVIGEIGGKRVAFLPRHGRRHELPPAQINYRANVWALRELGVRRIIGPCASGALRADLALGEFVVCDQFVDRTAGRADTFYEGAPRQPISLRPTRIARCFEHDARGELSRTEIGHDADGRAGRLGRLVSLFTDAHRSSARGSGA